MNTDVAKDNIAKWLLRDRIREDLSNSKMMPLVLTRQKHSETQRISSLFGMTEANVQEEFTSTYLIEQFGLEFRSKNPNLHHAGRAGQVTKGKK